MMPAPRLASPRLARLASGSDRRARVGGFVGEELSRRVQFLTSEYFHTCTTQLNIVYIGCYCDQLVHLAPMELGVQDGSSSLPEEDADPADPRMESNYGLGLFLVVLVTLAVSARARQSTGSSSSQHLTARERDADSQPDLKKLYGVFLPPYLLHLGVEWLTASYIIFLLDHFGYHPTHAAQILLGGVISQHVGAALLELGVLRFLPLKYLCLSCVVLQAIASALLLHSAFGGLVMSRIIGGTATAIGQTAFEGWMVQKHVGMGFPSEWLLDTFSLMSRAMGGLAVAVAFLGEFSLSVGNISGPFKLALLLCIVNALLISGNWTRDTWKQLPTCSDLGHVVLRAVEATKKPSTARLALSQAAFEVAMFYFAFSWPLLYSSLGKLSTPGEHPPYGIIFAQFMLCVLVGTFLYQILAKPAGIVEPRQLAASVCVVAAISFLAMTFGRSTARAIACLTYEVSFILCSGEVNKDDFALKDP
jgi:hypothetical protein